MTKYIDLLIHFVLLRKIVIKKIPRCLPSSENDLVIANLPFSLAPAAETKQCCPLRHAFSQDPLV